MKALQISSYGGNEVAHLSTKAPKPELRPGTVLVKVHCAGLNPVDWKIREGHMKDHVPFDFPATLGSDFSGVIEEMAEDITGFEIGDEVFGSAIVSLGGSGAIAEYLVTPAKNILKKPKDISHKIAAASATVGVCAHLCLEEYPVDKDSKVLVLGGSGGIGRAAIQLAKHKGAYVATTTRNKHLEEVKKTGADKVIDVSAQNFQDMLSGYDLVVDPLGDEPYKKSFSVLRKGGIIASVSSHPDETLMQKYEVDSKFILGFPNPELLEVITGYLQEGILVPKISTVFSLDEAVEALDYQQNGRPGGKIIIKIK